jgi:hypothetical protein
MKRILAAFIALHGAIALADWPSDAGDNVPVADYGYSATPSVISDGLEGVFVIFVHSDVGVQRSLRGEHFDSQANRLWSTANADGGYLGKDLLGISLGSSSNMSKSLAISDNDGGFIAGYSTGSTSPYTLSLQRFDKDGTAVWAPTGTYGGVQLLANPIVEQSFWMVPDDLGGALVTYESSGLGIYGQRLDPTGATRYGSGFLFAGGQAPGLSFSDAVAKADGLGGMYYIWPTSGSASISPSLDHVAADGGLVFTVPSVAPQLASFSEWSISGLSGGAGCWASWYGSSGLYLQLFIADGGAAFPDAGPAGGLKVSAISAYDPEPTMLDDGAGGVVLAWFDVTASVNVLYVQRFAADGSTVWGPVAVSSAATTPATESSYLYSYRLVPTRDGNVALFWGTTTYNINAEKVAMSNGARLWGPISGGVEVSSIPPQAIPYSYWIDPVFAEDDSAYVTYVDGLNRIYLKHVLADGTLGTSVVDAGSPMPDAGPDAGADAGPEDAGPSGPDGGMDSGIIIGHNGDAGNQEQDGGNGNGGNNGGNTGGNMKSGGCSSSSDARTASLWVIGLGLLALSVAARRRRAR